MQLTVSPADHPSFDRLAQTFSSANTFVIAGVADSTGHALCSAFPNAWDFHVETAKVAVGRVESPSADTHEMPVHGHAIASEGRRPEHG
jgi:hypothetical protein